MRIIIRFLAQRKGSVNRFENDFQFCGFFSKELDIRVANLPTFCFTEVAGLSGVFGVEPQGEGVGENEGLPELKPRGRLPPAVTLCEFCKSLRVGKSE
jgi:hypothetical protein